MASALRRRPNCFNLLHQMEIMMRGGYSGDLAVNNLEASLGQIASALAFCDWEHSGVLPMLQVMENTAAVVQAYQVGRTEAGAATNLLRCVSPTTRDTLKELVRTDKKNHVISCHVYV